MLPTNFPPGHVQTEWPRGRKNPNSSQWRQKISVLFRFLSCLRQNSMRFNLLQGGQGFPIAYAPANVQGSAAQTVLLRDELCSTR